jgi:hypothetical protein
MLDSKGPDTTTPVIIAVYFYISLRFILKVKKMIEIKKPGNAKWQINKVFKSCFKIVPERMRV